MVRRSHVDVIKYNVGAFFFNPLAWWVGGGMPLQLTSDQPRNPGKILCFARVFVCEDKESER